MGKEHLSKFQLTLLIGFGLIILASVIIFSKYKGSNAQVANIEIWGDMSGIDFNAIIAKTSLQNNKNLRVVYVEKNPETFDQELLEALAAGGGPDLFLLPNSKIYKQKNKIYLIPYTIFSERSFKDSFVEGTEIFLDPNGVIAMPMIADPLVMYWNRDIFNQSKVTQPPAYWDQFYNLATQMTKKDSALNVTQSAIAFGEFSNVSNAKAVLSNLFQQAGTPITTSNNGGASVLAESFGKPITPAEAAVNFYTEFSNPVKPYYSWNRSLPDSQTAFIAGDLAVYFGFASELATLQLKNPNLNFDVAYVPVSREGGVYVSYGDFYGLAISKNSKNPNAAYQAATVLSSAEGGKAVEAVLNLPSPRRDLLASKPDKAYKEIFYGSAIRAKAWLDPDPVATTLIMKNMVESITSGRDRTSSAISRASGELSKLFKTQ